MNPLCSPPAGPAPGRLRSNTDLGAGVAASPARGVAGNSRIGFAPLRWFAVALSAVIVLAVNYPVLDFDWLMFDDDINILVNPHLGSRAVESVQWAFENVDYMRRHLPLGWLMFAGLLAVAVTAHRCFTPPGGSSLP